MSSLSLESIPSREGAAGEAALTALFRRHASHLRLLALSSGCDHHEAEDAVQDLFLRLLQHEQVRSVAGLPDQHQQASLRLRLRWQLANRRRGEHRVKRGGRFSFTTLSLNDGDIHEIKDERTPIPGHSPWLSERSLHAALHRLQIELSPATWQRVRPVLEGDESLPDGYRTSATRVALCRARRRLRELLEADESPSNPVLPSWKPQPDSLYDRSQTSVRTHQMPF